MSNPQSHSYLTLLELQKQRVSLSNPNAQTALFLATRADEAAEKLDHFREQFERNQFPFEDLIKEIAGSKLGPQSLNLAGRWKVQFENLVEAKAESDTLNELVAAALKLACEREPDLR